MQMLICESYYRAMARCIFTQDLLYLPNQSLTLANKLSWFILGEGSIIARFSSFTGYLLRPELSIEAERTAEGRLQVSAI